MEHVTSPPKRKSRAAFAQIEITTSFLPTVVCLEAVTTQQWEQQFGRPRNHSSIGRLPFSQETVRRSFRKPAFDLLSQVAR
ncbi:hypothetical protein RBWH47_03114 [Rhodopirellula baltica WH47]|uniref:Uncharacterized protein n=1 Tax=Rhodopirellula baltica WH47 TaxID=991778 RepID=F2AZZ4_RHOBT|nr:hypothetical protein RBWH47_03114 [Rhodopirellula baltica WH47]